MTRRSLKRNSLQVTFLIMMSLLGASCISARQISREGPSPNPPVLQNSPRGLSLNGLKVGQSLVEISDLVRVRNLELVSDTELGIARIRDPNTGEFILSMTFADGKATGLYSEKKSGLFVNSQFVLAQGSPAAILSTFDPELKQPNGLHTFVKDDFQFEVFCKGDKVSSFRLMGVSNTGEKSP